MERVVARVDLVLERRILGDVEVRDRLAHAGLLGRHLLVARLVAGLRRLVPQLLLRRDLRVRGVHPLVLRAGLGALDQRVLAPVLGIDLGGALVGVGALRQFFR
ncbi:hypothetical protein [Kocuria kalidii]|uniref:hypothetical protein n=1 Tax=Kocuria kalidii TaxID=3376283 RepID=UPI0037A30C16